MAKAGGCAVEKLTTAAHRNEFSLSYDVEFLQPVHSVKVSASMPANKQAARLKSTVLTLLPVTIEPGGIRYAPGVRAGRWIFATGHKGTADFVNGMAPEVLDAAAPRHGVPKTKKEARRIFANFDKVLKAGGSDRQHVVRVDQYYTSGPVVPAYHEARRDFFGGHVPPSTSNLHQKFLLAGQDMEVQMMAVVPGKDFEVAQHRPANLPVHASSSYSPVLTCGDYVFVAGQTAEAFKTEEGPIDPAARLPAGVRPNLAARIGLPALAARPATSATNSLSVLGAIVFLIGTALSTRAIRVSGSKDPQFVVCDEFLAFAWVYLLVPVNWSTAVAGFALFRLFDITKPGPVGWADRQPGPLGVMGDDLIAGALAAAALLLMEALL